MKMKKIIFWILSLLLITPVFAEDIDLSRQFNSYISFESLVSDSHITYWSYNYSSRNSYNRLWFYYLDSSLNPDYWLNYYSSVNNQVWIYFDSDLGFPFTSSWDISSGLSINNNYFWMLWIGFNNWKLLSNQFSIYFQAFDNSTFDSYWNRLLNFWWEFQTWTHYVNVKNSYVRALYNNSSRFSNSVFPSLLNPSSPSDIQLFTRWNNYLYTTKWRASVNDIYYDKIVSSIWNWFSFVSSIDWSVTFEDLKFISVLPYWDSSWSSSSSLYSVPSTSYIDWVYIFRLNSLWLNSSRDFVWVLSKCSVDLCSWFSLSEFLSSLVYSEYVCDFSSDFWIKSNCDLLDWWILYNVLWNITWLDQSISVSSLPLIFKPFYNYFWTNYTSLWTSLNTNSDSSVLTISYFWKPDWYATTPESIYSESYNIINTWVYTSVNPPDILWVTDFIQDLPPNITDSIWDLQSRYCDQNPTSPYCNWIYTWSRDDVRCVVNDSWIVNCYFTDYSRPTSEAECPTIESWLDNWQTFVQYRSTWENRCIQWVSTTYSDSAPEFNSTSLESWWEYWEILSLSFSWIISWFNIHQCPFNSPFGVLRLWSIAWLSSFLLDKFFDVNIIWPFSCLLWWTLYSTSNSQSLSYSLVDYEWEKFLSSWSDTAKEYINYILTAFIILFFRRFRPHSDDH